jgi:hypothetical protein
MNHQAATDHGTVLETDQAALIVDPDGSFRLLFPDIPESAEASRGHALIAAIAMKMSDPEWTSGLLADLAAAVAKGKAN